MDVTVGQPYLEPTQWAVDVEIGGVKTQLTFGPADRAEPTQAEIDTAINALISPGTLSSGVMDMPVPLDAVISPGVTSGD